MTLETIERRLNNVNEEINELEKGGFTGCEAYAFLKKQQSKYELLKANH